MVKSEAPRWGRELVCELPVDLFLLKGHLWASFLVFLRLLKQICKVYVPFPFESDNFPVDQYVWTGLKPPTRYLLGRWDIMQILKSDWLLST